MLTPPDHRLLEITLQFDLYSDYKTTYSYKQLSLPLYLPPYLSCYANYKSTRLQTDLLINFHEDTQPSTETYYDGRAA